MARADLLTDLVKFGMACDRARFRAVVESIIAEERGKKHTVLAEKLEELLRSIPSEKPVSNGTATLDHRTSNLVREVMPERKLDELILPKEVVEIVREGRPRAPSCRSTPLL